MIGWVVSLDSSGEPDLGRSGVPVDHLGVACTTIVEVPQVSSH